MLTVYCLAGSDTQLVPSMVMSHNAINNSRPYSDSQPQSAIQDPKTQLFWLDPKDIMLFHMEPKDITLLHIQTSLTSSYFSDSTQWYQPD